MLYRLTDLLIPKWNLGMNFVEKFYGSQNRINRV